MSHRKFCTLIGSDKGGVGKSLVAQIMVIAHDQAGMPLKVVEIDHQRKLTSIFGDRVDLAMDATVDVSHADKANRLVETFFDRAYDLWAAGDSLTDLGANVTTSLLSWFEHCDVGTIADQDGVAFRFVALATPDDQALRSAIASLEKARTALGPNAQLFLILNNAVGAGGFDPYRSTDLWRQISSIQVTHGVRLIELPYCGSSIMDFGRAWGLTIAQVLNQETELMDRISAAAGFSRVERHHQVKRFVDWVRAVQMAMQPLFESPHSAMRAAAE